MRRIVLLLVINLLLIPSLVAQSPNGTISGIVHDPSGAVIAGAEIIVVNDATSVQYSTKTNNEGIYVVPNLPPGSYRIQVAKIGFKTIIKPDIILNVQDALAINFTLPVGAASETVTVQGGAPLINTESAAVSTVIDRNFVEGLPLNGRSFNTLLQLTPGVVIAPITGVAASFGEAPGEFSIAGQRTDANAFSVDGVSANFGVGNTTGIAPGEAGTGTAQAFSALGGTSSLASVEDLREFRIETSSFAPEFGRVPGGQVILTTRSGTNDLHGEIYEYFRNNVLDANDWFADALPGSPQAPERHNDFGGILGGPILKNSTFFFLSYEGARLDLPGSESIEVPSESARAQASATLAPFLDAYPRPNGQPASPTAFTAPFTGVFSNSGTLDAGSIRIDRTFNDRFSIFGRYNNAPSQLANHVNSLNNIQTTAVNTQTLTLGMDMLLGTQLANAFRGNYSTQNADSSYALTSFGGAVPLKPSLLLGSLSSDENNGEFFPFDASPLETGPFVRSKASQINFVDDLSITSGAHAIKIGGDYRGIFSDSADTEHLVDLTSVNVQTFLSSGMVNLATSSKTEAQLLSQAFSVYAQDVWKITRRLTLTYGLRWELSPPPSARGATILVAWDNVNNPAEISPAPRGTPLWRTTYGNVAPRVGISYSLSSRGDLVLRAGGGIFYDTGMGASANLADQFPNLASAFHSNVSVPVANLDPFLPVLSLQAPYPTVAAVSPNLKLPRSYQWNTALEKSFRKEQVVSVTYAGQAGRGLLRQEALFRPNPNFSSAFELTQNDARSNYNSLQLQYRRPLSAHVQALMNYTWSHSLDNASNDVLAGLSSTILSAQNDYASSDFDVRQSFSGAFIYNIRSARGLRPLAFLTNGWSIDAVIIARTGFPFNAVVFAPSVLGVSLSRPDLVPGQPLWISNSTAPGGKLLNGNAFSVPSTVRQGTEGRNDIPGFGLTQVDFSVDRKFPITERIALQFRADAFNLFNHPNFTNPVGAFQFGPAFLESQEMLNQGLGGLNPLFQEGGPRSLQLSLKLSF